MILSKNKFAWSEHVQNDRPEKKIDVQSECTFQTTERHYFIASVEVGKMTNSIIFKGCDGHSWYDSWGNGRRGLEGGCLESLHRQKRYDDRPSQHSSALCALGTILRRRRAPPRACLTAIETRMIT
jgi:hypothetical protein